MMVHNLTSFVVNIPNPIRIRVSKINALYSAHVKCDFQVKC